MRNGIRLRMTLLPLLLALLCAAGGRRACAEACVAVNSTNFPDPSFREYVSEAFDDDGNGQLDASEIAEAYSLRLEEYGDIVSLKGIEFLTALTSVDCSSNQLTELDVSACTALTSLSCDSNQLTELNVRGCTAITFLSCGYNELTELDVSTCTALENLFCECNELTELDINACPALRYLECSRNQLTKLKVSKSTTQNTVLAVLNCNSNQLTELDVTRNPALLVLECSYNQLSDLDIKHNTELLDLDCSSNQLSNLDVSRNTALEKLDCGFNQLPDLDVSRNTALKELHCSDIQVTSLDLTRNTALETLSCSDNQLTELDLSRNTALKEIFCKSNQLSALNVSGCTGLTYLECTSNKLKKLDVSRCTGLETLECWKNQLTELNVGGNGALESLDCCYNQLTVLDVSHCAALEYLECYSNLLTSLNIINNPSLKEAFAGTKIETEEYTHYTGHYGYMMVDPGLLIISEPGPAVTTQPKAVSAAVGATVKFTVAATGSGLKYQWQYRYPGESWKNSGYTSGKTATLSFAAQAKYNKMQYRCRITDANGNSVTSSAVTLTILPKITVQPKSISAAVGAMAKFPITATGAGLKYQWQYKYPDGSWTNSGYASGKTATLSFAAQAKYNKMQYRCKVTDENGKTVTSSAVTLTITPKITAQPKSIGAYVGATAKFTVTATGAGLKYQWQYKYPDGSWTNSGYASGKTATLSFTAQAKYNKMQYRCRITDENGKTVTSSAVTLTINPKITAQPRSVTASAGTTVKFTVTATGAGLKYQWQYKYPDGSWTNSGYSSAKTAVLSVPAQAKYNGIQYRCVITDANGKTVTSGIAGLTVR